MLSTKKIIIMGVIAIIVVITLYVLRKSYQQNHQIIYDTTSEPDPMKTNTTYTEKDYRNTLGLLLGIKQNNPGNLRVTASKWQGKVPSVNGFETFISIKWGIRAAIINISNLIKTYGSIEHYITAYAPPSDGNDTEAYINYVSAKTGINRASVPPLNKDVLTALAWAHFEMENGMTIARLYITQDDMDAAISLTVYA